MQAALRVFTALFGAVCVAIGLVHIAFGPTAIPGSVPVNATMDSEDRFYATLFVGFGVAIVWASSNLAARSGAFLSLLAVFFCGGVARIVSAIAVGPPSPLFVFLGSLELILPPLMWVWHRRAFAA